LARCRGEHDAWHVIACESQRALDRASPQHHALCADQPGAAARDARIGGAGALIAHLFDQSDEIVVMVGNRRRP
jgi:hypothetical protein